VSWLGSIYPVLILTAAAMSGINLYVIARLLPRSGGPPNLARAILVGYILVASSVFWIVLPWALLVPNLTSYYTVLTLMTLPMPAPFLWMMAALFRAEERSIASGSPSWAFLVAGALVANELFMSVSFAVAISGYSGDFTGLLGTSFNAVWFAAPMLATMALLLFLAPLTSFERRAFGGLAATVAVGPLLLVSPLAAGLAMAVLMTVVLLLLADGARGASRLSASEGAVAIGVVVAFAAMAAAEVASIVLPGAGTTGLPYGIASVLVMLAEGAFLVRRGLSRREVASPESSSGAPAGAPSSAA
jgi:hypothetical protein